MWPWPVSASAPSQKDGHGAGAMLLPETRFYSARGPRTYGGFSSMGDPQHHGFHYGLILDDLGYPMAPLRQALLRGAELVWPPASDGSLDHDDSELEGIWWYKHYN